MSTVPPTSTTAGARTIGGTGDPLAEETVTRFVADALADVDLDGRTVCIVIPDSTRSCPLPLLLGAVHSALVDRVAAMTAVVALGTHAPMSEDHLARWLGYDVDDPARRYPGLQVINHRWDDPATFVDLGHISAQRIGELSGGLLHVGVDVKINRAVVEHDIALVVGPVFPHEVVGFSGGNKYFFPGVAGQEVIDLSHWLGALITSANIIGTRGITPVRAMIDQAAQLIPAQRLALCTVVQTHTGKVLAASFGTPEDAWAAAADVAAQTHVRYLDAPVRRVVSVIPHRYDDIWTAAKGFYKLEPVVADGGEVILYAPHITQLAAMHPEIEQIGYHCRDYFVQQWDRFAHLHWGALAHSTHLRGAGTWDPHTGEHDRVKVTLATGIPEHVVRAANLDYLDPATVDLDAAAADPDTFFVPDAGEVLYRLRGEQ
ncbi:lactate racemase domain-containing protein [uncultured Jatrophihabitans sp.]|uniref:lactate racemase domain-containing protein n=1 Tax=uncultured Jatrophihabitans sp. TaxID=1610747 RepID=UPI0035CAA71C